MCTIIETRDRSRNFLNGRILYRDQHREFLLKEITSNFPNRIKSLSIADLQIPDYALKLIQLHPILCKVLGKVTKQ
jgi:hypothetical protein